ncbi:MAG TPA: TlpA disulfide reductase family protein [Candidatus Angelobacter sp.]|nr:TlpA disulfide reductase family protein [Candidatus Angelobacter sp.]
MVVFAWALLIQPAFADDEALTTRVKVGDAAPDFSCQTISGEQFSLSGQRGKVVLVNFFATWCGPCMVEMPQLDKEVFQKFASRKDFKLVAIGREHSAAELTKFNSEKGFTIPIAPDPKREIYAKYADKYIPRNFVIGKDGKIKLTTVGFSPEDLQRISQTIQQELDK